MNGNASTVSWIGNPCLVRRRKADSMAVRHSAKFILVKLFLRYVLEMRTEKTCSAASYFKIEGACIDHGCYREKA